MKRYHDKYGDSGFDVCVISSGEDTRYDDVVDFFEKRQYGFPVLIDDPINLKFSKDCGVKAQPATFLVDSSGEILYQHYGFSEDSTIEIQEYLHKYFKNTLLTKRDRIVLTKQELEASSDVDPYDPNDFLRNSNPLSALDYLAKVEDFEQITIKDWSYELKLEIAKEKDSRRNTEHYANHYWKVTNGYIDLTLEMPRDKLLASAMLDVIRSNHVSFITYIEQVLDKVTPQSRPAIRKDVEKLEERVESCTYYLKAIISEEL